MNSSFALLNKHDTVHIVQNHQPLSEKKKDKKKAFVGCQLQNLEYSFKDYQECFDHTMW